jgi:hypothetical protein
VEKFIESETVEKIFFLSQHMKVCIWIEFFLCSP